MNDDEQDIQAPEVPGMATSRWVELIKRDAWKPPAKLSPREGADDFKQWPSKGGD